MMKEWRGMRGGKENLSMDRFTDNLSFWASQLWSVCWHFLLEVLPISEWCIEFCLGLYIYLSFLCVRQNFVCPSRDIFPPAKPASAASDPIPLGIMDPDHTWSLWDLGGWGMRRASEVWGAEKPHGESHLLVRNLFKAVSGVLSWKNWWIFVAFRKWFGLEELWKRRQDLSLPEVLLSHVGLWDWDGSQMFGPKPPAKVTVCTQFVKHNVHSAWQLGFVTHWVMGRECPGPESDIYL